MLMFLCSEASRMHHQTVETYNVLLRRTTGFCTGVYRSLFLHATLSHFKIVFGFTALYSEYIHRKVEQREKRQSKGLQGSWTCNCCRRTSAFSVHHLEFVNANVSYVLNLYSRFLFERNEHYVLWLKVDQMHPCSVMIWGLINVLWQSSFPLLWH